MHHHLGKGNTHTNSLVGATPRGENTDSHRDTELVTRLRSETKAPHGRTLEEGVGGAGVLEGEEALALDRHGQEHGVVRPDSSKSVYRNDKGVSVSVHCGGGLLRQDCIYGLRVAVVEVVHLQEEQAGAHVPTHVLLVAIVAEALATAFLHLRRCQATEGAGGCSGSGRIRRRRSGRNGRSASPSSEGDSR